ncbi:hypothetical protein [Commensalibacter nepenthis]|uniref:Uncharacterized protein n=1 Tax=Commensalibacter nepenthis TaxID=3043872 RepID=A0ABT6Q4G5_9PROT|nr:hypothetical protein [Commensalibacter sp. TBRC 10068]MDI2111784.1 hypothetical protein [Commensalibacter sp. TBRC 10068]
MFYGKEAIYYGINLFKKALILEKRNSFLEAVYQYGSVLDVYYTSMQQELKDIALYAIRSLFRLCQKTNYQEPAISVTIYHSERLPLYFQNETDFFTKLILVEVLCKGIYLCLQPKSKNTQKAKKMFNYLKTHYKSYPERKIQRQITKITKFIKKQK